MPDAGSRTWWPSISFNPSSQSSATNGRGLFDLSIVSPGGSIAVWASNQIRQLRAAQLLQHCFSGASAIHDAQDGQTSKSSGAANLPPLAKAEASPHTWQVGSPHNTYSSVSNIGDIWSFEEGSYQRAIFLDPE